MALGIHPTFKFVLSHSSGLQTLESSCVLNSSIWKMSSHFKLNISKTELLFHLHLSPCQLMAVPSLQLPRSQILEPSLIPLSLKTPYSICQEILFVLPSICISKIWPLFTPTTLSLALSVIVWVDCYSNVFSFKWSLSSRRINWYFP